MVDHSSLNSLPAAVKQRISQLNDLFVESVGPIGRELSEDVFAQWVRDGKFGPAAIRHYVLALSEQIDIASEQKAFLQRAEKLLLQ